MNKCGKCAYKTGKVDLVFKRKTDDELLDNLNELLDKWTCEIKEDKPLPNNIDAFLVYVERKATRQNCIDDLKKVLSNE